MIKEVSWKFCNNIKAILGGEGIIYFVDPQKKSLYKDVKKRLGKRGCREFSINNSGFEIKLINGYLYAKHKDLGPDYLKIGFISTDQDIINIISQSSIDNGVFAGDNWSIIFNNFNKCIPARDGIDLYDKSWDESLRLANCELGKHTTKIEPGYQYDNTENTYYYLGEFFSTGEYSYKNSGDKLVYGFLVGKKDFGKERSLSKIYFDNVGDVVFLKKKPSGFIKVDKFADDDLLDTYKELPEFVDTWIKNNEMPYSEYNTDLVIYKNNISKLFDPFLFKKATECKMDTSKIREVVKNEMTRLLYQNYNTHTKYPSSSNTLEKNKELLINCFFDKSLSKVELESNGKISIIRSKDYYFGLLKYLNIDLRVLAEEVFNDFINPKPLRLEWDSFLKYFIYFENHPIGLTGKLIDTKKGVFPNTYKEEIVNFVNEITEKIKQSSTSWEEFHITNMGTLTNPKIEETIFISLEGIIRSYENNIPEDIKELIIKEGLFNFTIINKLY